MEASKTTDLDKYSEHIIAETADLKGLVEFPNSLFKLKFVLGAYSLNPDNLSRDARILFEYYVVKNDALEGPYQPNKALFKLIHQAMKMESSNLSVNCLNPLPIIKHLKCGNDNIIVEWTSEPATRKIKLEIKNKIVTKEVIMPGSYFRYQADSQELYHYTRIPVKKKDKLLASFMPNVYSEHKVCLGQNKIPPNSFRHINDLVTGAEQIFWNGIFTHYHNDNSKELWPLFTSDETKIEIPIKKLDKYEAFLR